MTMAYVQGGPGVAASPQTPAIAAEPTSALLTLKSGVTLHYVVQGRADGQPIVLLHGIGDSWRSYEPMLRHLPDTYRVYAVTLRGHGYSDRPASGYAQSDFAGDVRQFLEALDLRRVTLVGHSLGSFVAQRVAVEDAARLARLVLIGSGPGGLGNDAMRQEVSAMFMGVTDPMTPAFARDFQASVSARPVPAAFYETMVAELLRVPGRVFHQAVPALDDRDTLRRLSALQVPTLLIWGDRDSLFGRQTQDALLAAVPGSRLVVYEGTGHTPQWEEPARVAADVLRFAGGD